MVTTTTKGANAVSSRVTKMETEIFAGGGVLAAVLAGAGYMLRFLVQRVKELSDEYIVLVQNHLSHNTEALIELKNVLQLIHEDMRKDR